MKMKNGNYNNVEDISTENLYKLLERAKKSQGDYVAQVQCIEKELARRVNQNFIDAVDTNAIDNLSSEQLNQVADILGVK